MKNTDQKVDVATTKYANYTQEDWIAFFKTKFKRLKHDKTDPEGCKRKLDILKYGGDVVILRYSDEEVERMKYFKEKYFKDTTAFDEYSYVGNLSIHVCEKHDKIPDGYWKAQVNGVLNKLEDKEFLIAARDIPIRFLTSAHKKKYVSLVDSYAEQGYSYIIGVNVYGGKLVTEERTLIGEDVRRAFRVKEYEG